MMGKQLTLVSIVANNTPVFFIRDPTKFPEFIHTQKRDPQTHLKDPEYVEHLSLQTLRNDVIFIACSVRHPSSS